MRTTTCLLFLLCLLITQLLITDGANPISKLFRMKNREIGSSHRGRNLDNDDEDNSCIAPEVVEDEIRKMELSHEQTQKELDQTKQLLIKYENELNEYKHEAHTRVDQLAKCATESTEKFATIQADFNKRIENIQEKSENEINIMKTTILTKDDEIKQIQLQCTEQINTTKESIENQYKTTEVELREELKELEINNQQLLKQLENDYITKTKKLEEEKSILIGEKHAIELNCNKIEEKYEYILRDQESAINTYIEEQLTIRVDEETTIRIANLSNELNELRTQCKQKQLDDSIQITSLKDTLQNTIEKMTNEHNTIVTNMKETHTTTIEEMNNQHTIEVRNLQETHTALIDKLTTEYKTYEEQSIATINELQTKYNELEESVTKQLNDVQIDTERQINEVKEQYKEQIRDIKNKNQKKINELQSNIDTLEEDKSKLRKSLTKSKSDHETTKKKLKDALKDAKHWETLYENRSYVNVTQITQDTILYATEKYHDISEQVINSEFVHKSIDTYQSINENHITPTKEKTRILYNTYMKKHIEIIIIKHIKPIYKKYMSTHVKTIKKKWRILYKSFTSWRIALFNEMVLQFQSSCPIVFDIISTIENKIGHDIPSGITNSIRTACDHPDAVVEAFIKATLITTIIAFITEILWVIYKIITIIIKIIWYLSPIRIVISFIRNKIIIIRKDNDNNNNVGDNNNSSENSSKKDDKKAGGAKIKKEDETKTTTTTTTTKK